MSNLRNCVLLLLFVYFQLREFAVEGKVFSVSHFSKELRHVSLRERTFGSGSALGFLESETGESTGTDPVALTVRKRRSANGSDKQQPLITRTLLPDSDEKHNEAIVHWSGKNSTVSMTDIRYHSIFRIDVIMPSIKIKLEFEMLPWYSGSYVYQV